MINTLNNLEKRKLLLFEIILNMFMIFLQVLIFFSYDIFLTFNWWYYVLIRCFFILSFLVIVFCCFLFYKILQSRRVMLSCILLQCIGAGISIYLHADYLHRFDGIIPNKFMLLPYLFCILFSFCILFLTKKQAATR